MRWLRRDRARDEAAPTVSAPHEALPLPGTLAHGGPPPIPGADLWYVVRGADNDLEFLTDVGCLSQGGRWGTLGQAYVFCDETLATAVASRLPDARMTNFS